MASTDINRMGRVVGNFLATQPEVGNAVRGVRSIGTNEKGDRSPRLLIFVREHQRHDRFGVVTRSDVQFQVVGSSCD